MNRVLATLVLAISLTAAAVAGAGVASAHATRVATDPVENTELTQAPQKVSATFNEALQPAVRRDDGRRPRWQPVVDG